MCEVVEWRVVPRNHNYEVSSHGDVRRRTRGVSTFPGRMLKPFNLNGYLAVGLCPTGRETVHVLVCEAFHGPRPEGMREIRHLDGNKLNNCKDNLRYGTNSENRRDFFRHNRIVGEIANKSLFTNEYVAYLRALYKQAKRSSGYVPKGWARKLAEKEGINWFTLSNILAGNGYPDA